MRLGEKKDHDCFFNSDKNYRFQKNFTNEYYVNEGYCLLIRYKF